MLIIGGATATGKSKLGVMLAKMADGEIVSADSMQIYRYMNIGTAKVTAEEMQGIPHYMLDIVEPTEEFSVAEYQKKAQNIIDDIKNRGKLPIIVGGTGLYINSLIYPLQFGSSFKDELLRKKLNKDAEKFGNDYIYNKLIEIDPIAAENIHKNNIKRIIRAIEVKTLSGKSVSETEDKKEPIYHKIYAFKADRDVLYQKINQRVDIMFEDGLADEIDSLINQYKVNFSCQSMQAIGYKEFFGYYNKEKTLDEVRDLIKKNSRHYAKRQYTWFKAYENCKWLEGDISKELCQNILDDYYENCSNLE